MAIELETLNYAVQIDNVCHRYNHDELALRDITLTIPTGCLTGIIGPDGVGKSTLLSLIAGVKRLQHGEIFTLNQNIRISQARKNLAQHIAFLPQGLGNNLYGDLSVYDNIAFFADVFLLQKKIAHERILALTERTGLSPFLTRKANQLSGGMKQKLGLCCALVHTPQLLILDEPTTGIDPLSRQQFWQLIHDIRHDHTQMAVIVATSYMAEAAQFDSLFMLNAGTLLAQGTPQQLMAETQSQDLETAYIALLPQSHRDKMSIRNKRIKSQTGIAIEAKNLTKRFGDFIAVNALNFTIHSGEIFGFIGQNGCGKTTTMKMLIGLLPPTSGQALLFNQPIQINQLQLRKRFGYMSQSFSLYSEISIRDNLKLHAALFDLSKSHMKTRFSMVTQFFNLREFLDMKPKQLPLGIRQRLSLAVAVLHEPELLILDEPTSGVDPIARHEFWRLIDDLSRQHGVTIFVSTHYLTEAMNCDRVILMEAGRILAYETPQQLLARYPGNNLEQVFIHLVNEGK